MASEENAANSDGAAPAFGDELHSGLRMSSELEPASASLQKQVASLQSELASALEVLRARESELDQLKASLAPPRMSERPESPPPSSPGGYPELQRVSLELSESSSLPPADPDAAPGFRRRAPRRGCALELEFTRDTHFYAGLTQDLSQGGVFVATYQLFPVGSRLELGFQLPDGTQVRTRGVVRWLRAEGEAGAERPGMGIAFLDLSEEALAGIARFCRERAPLYMEV